MFFVYIQNIVVLVKKCAILKKMYIYKNFPQLCIYTKKMIFWSFKFLTKKMYIYKKEGL